MFFNSAISLIMNRGIATPRSMKLMILNVLFLTAKGTIIKHRTMMVSIITLKVNNPLMSLYPMWLLLPITVNKTNFDSIMNMNMILKTNALVPPFFGVVAYAG